MAELFRFRCYRCQKLMGAPASRYGKTVKCPACGAELVVPVPEGEAASGPSGDPDGGENDFGIDLGGLDLSLKPAPARSTSGTSLRDPNYGSSQTNPITAFLQANPPEEEPAPGPIPGSDETETDAVPIVAVQTARQVSPLTGRKPIPTDFDSPSRRRDVVLPRTVVLAWALGALLGLAFAFLAGLMIGHYLW